MKISGWIFCFVVLSSFLSVSLGNQVGFLNYGSTKDDETNEKSFFWSIEYRQDLRENCAFSFSWLNEGHFENHNIHHRDGQSAQIWAKQDIIDKKFSLSAGIGPYLYFDTTGVVQDENYRDEHGLGLEYSLAGIWYLKDPWIVKAQVNYIDTDDFDTFSLSLGVGYLFGGSSLENDLGFRKSWNTTDREITMFLGSTIVNSFNSEKSPAINFEYRQKLSEHVGWTLSWIEEGDADLIKRMGVATQIWPTRSFFDESLSLGAGVGPYVFNDKKDGDGNGIGLAGLVSVTASYHISEEWSIRFLWNRVVSDYNRDSDILLFGVGYRF